MNNKTLKEYIEMFADGSEVGVIVANPKYRKIYDINKVFAIKDDKIDRPILCIDVGIARNLDADEQENAMGNERTAQPEFPKLKNNEQRKEFLQTYRGWPVWFEVPQADEIYYRYILPDNSAIVICECKQYVIWKERYTDENPESTYTKSYLLNPGYHHLHDCETNETALVKKLMEVQRK